MKTESLNERTSLTMLAQVSVLTLLSVPAYAQTVELFGTADAGVVNAHGTSPAGSVNALASGILAPSRWGLRGSEDLGGGLRGIFTLEAGLDLDTGTAKAFAGNPATATPSAPNGTTSTGFNRRAFVGLVSDFGTLALGRDYTPVYYSAYIGDVLGLGSFGNIQQILQPAGGTERFARASNGIFYTSPAFGGFQARAAYSFGSESPGGAGALPKHANEFIGIGVDYKSGALSVGTSFQQLRLPVVGGTPAAFTGELQRRNDALLGIKYAFGPVTLGGGYWTVNKPLRASDLWLGMSYQAGQGTVTAQVQRLRQDNPSGGQRSAAVLSLAYVYALSKRTTLYASYGRVNNNETGAFGLVSSDFSLAPSAAGANPSALGLGIRHNF
jgi:predicted porin